MRDVFAAVEGAGRDAVRAWKITPHWYDPNKEVVQRHGPWRLRERLLIKVYVSVLLIKIYVSARTFRHSLAVRRAAIVSIPQLGKEGLLANVLHVLEVLQRVRPDARVDVCWRIDGTERGFRYGAIGEDVWPRLFAAFAPPERRCLVAHAILDYALWGSGKDYLTGAALERQRRAYKRTLDTWIHIASSRVREEIEDLYTRGFRGRWCLGVHRRVAHAAVATCQRDGRVPTVEQFLERIRAHIEAANIAEWMVFLATDDQEAVPAFRGAFGDRLIVREVQRTTRDEGEVHFRDWGALSLRDAEDVLIDTWLLSRCAVLFHVSSSISLTASLLNPDLSLVRVAGS